MTKFFFSFVTMLLLLLLSSAFAAAPGTMQPGQPVKPPSRNIPQLQLTPDYLFQQITALKQQVQLLQAQVNSLRSVVQIAPNGTTIAAEELTIKGDKNLALSSSKNIGMTAGDVLAINGEKGITLKSGKDLSGEAGSQLKLKAPLIKLNDGTKGIALKDSPVAGGKVISGSTTILAK